MTRVGLVGYGMAGQQFHAPLITAAGMELVAISTGNAERAATAAQDVPGAQVVPDLDALLAVSGLDLVVLASPTGAHVEQARRVVEAGVPVVVDKPLGVDASTALEAVDAARHAGVALTVFQNRRYDSDVRTLAAVVAERRVGDVVRAEFRWERWRPVPKDRWRENTPSDQGGGILLDLFSHMIDQAQLLFGRVHTVYAELAALTTVSEDTVFLSCRHESGVVSHLGSTSLAAAPGPSVRLLGREAAYLVGAVREESVAFTEWGPSDEKHLGWLVHGEERQPVPTVFGDEADFYREVDAALRTDDPQAAMPVDPTDAVHVLAVIDAARASAEDARVVEVVTPGEAP